MKKQILSLALMLFSTFLIAQKVDLDPYYLRTDGFYTLPYNPLPEDYKTYNVRVNSPGTIKNTFPDDRVESSVKINGWKQVGPKEKAHLTVEVTLNYLTITKSDIKERKVETKDKDGKVTSTQMLYSGVFEYNMNGNTYSVSDYTGKKIELKGVRYLTTGSESSAESANYTAARDFLNNNRDNFKDKFAIKLSEEICRGISSAATYAWGLQETPVNGDYFWLMDSKKHPEQDSMQLMAKFMKEEFLKMKPSELNASFKTRMMPFINYLSNLPVKYKTDEKNDKKLRYAAYFGLAKMYYYLDNPVEMRKYAALLEKNDYDPKDAKGIIKDADALENAMKAAKINTRHLLFDINSFESPK
jgi:hypothetical protein